MTDVTVIAIDGDTIAKPEFHAKPLFDAVERRVPSQYFVMQGHHFAFIAPFPKRVTDHEDIPIAKDPKGFDRSAFLDVINGIIVDAMKKGSKPMNQQ